MNTIAKGTVLGKDTLLSEHIVIGKQPMKAKNSAITKDEEKSPALIGDNCKIGVGVIIYAGATIGDNCLIADYATIREDVVIGDETIIGCKAIIENHCSIGKRCKIQSAAYITAHSVLEDDVFVAPGVMTSNDAFMARSAERFGKYKGIIARKGARIGVGAVVLPGVELEEDCMVGAGSIVTKNVPSKKVVIGSPAKVVKDVPSEQLLENQ